MIRLLEQETSLSRCQRESNARYPIHRLHSAKQGWRRSN